MSDRRTEKTKNSIIEAFYKLLQADEVTTITVSKLCRTANINRGTFYLHYQDIYELMDILSEDYIDELKTILLDAKKREDYESLVFELFTFFDNNRQFMKAFFTQSNYIDFAERLTKVFTPYFEAFLHLHPEDAIYYTAFFNFGYFGIVKHWLNGNDKRTPKEMATLISSFKLMKDH